MVLEEFIREWENDCPTVTVRTSGSTGVPKEMAVEKARMAASAEVTCDFLGLKEGDRALLCLPVDYIAGKMMVVRSKVRGLDLASVEPSGHPLAGVSASERFDLCAMVPMQVYNSLQSPEEAAKLKNIKHLIIGGGAIDESLAEKLRSFPNNVWSTYGMTETLSHIALRRLNGDNASEWYTPFDGVTVWTNADGCLVIDAPRVCAEVLMTNDIAETEKDDSGRVVRFRIKGRKDNVICSGGVKIQIEEAERMLKDKLSLPFLITKKKDCALGEKVVLLAEDDNLEGVEEKCKSVMPKYWLPRLYIHVDAVPQTETGKPARAEAVKIAERFTEP
ncbi:MAG: AMP-binding protein [Paludibacteraceae bacterium]|nr:AMP-binding protein [Paludibacteraceae bacterium]